MLGRIPIRKYLLSSILPFKIFEDNDRVSDSNTSRAYYEKIEDDETGWDRLYMMFSLDEYGVASPEIHSSLQAAFLGMFVGGCYGGFIRSRLAYLDFMERNQATVYKSHLDAKKKLQDHVTVNFAKGAFQWGWRLAFFTGSYVLISTSISVYRGKSSIWEYMAAGTVTGACYKLNMGLRGMLAGGIVGCFMATIAGGVSLALLKASGMTVEEMRIWQYKWKQSRLKHINQAVKKYRSAEDSPLLIHHDEKLETSGDYLESLDSSPEITDTRE